MFHRPEQGPVGHRCTFQALLAFLLIFLSGAQSMCHAELVVYSVTTSQHLVQNPNGTWGGDLAVGENLSSEFTFVLRYNAEPERVFGPEAQFSLASFQIFDNTAGTASASLIPTPSFGTLAIRYNGSDDRMTGGGFGPSGAMFKTDFRSLFEMGDPGDSLPFGAAFDAFVESSPLLLAGRADLDSPFGNFPDDLSPGTFTVESAFVSAVPEPTSALYLATLIGFSALRRKR